MISLFFKFSRLWSVRNLDLVCLTLFAPALLLIKYGAQRAVFDDSLRWVEHAGWVVFEDIFLIRSCRQSVQEMRELATRQARLEETNEIINAEVRERTADLASANAQLTHELAVARELSDAADREHQLWLQGESIVVRALRESVEARAASEKPLLLTGQAGAGQEAVARAVHRNSPRAARPFIYVACPHAMHSEDTVLRPASDLCAV